MESGDRRGANQVRLITSRRIRKGQVRHSKKNEISRDNARRVFPALDAALSKDRGRLVHGVVAGRGTAIDGCLQNDLLDVVLGKALC
jgi:hypothetical protein